MAHFSEMILLDLPRADIDSIFSRCLSAASKEHTEDHKAAIFDGRASLYFAPTRGFALVGKSPAGDLVILAAAGIRVCVADQMELLIKLAFAEGCQRLACEVVNPKLARKLSGLGWNVKSYDGKTFSLTKELFHGRQNNPRHDPS